MDDKRSAAERMGAIEGADEGALGLGPPPAPANPEATVDDSEELVPGATFGDRDRTKAKPWFTSLAAESQQAGVGNTSPAAQDPQFPDGDDEAIEDDDAP